MNPQEKPWTYSQLNCYVICPLKYYLTYEVKALPYIETKEMRYGNEVHKSFENYLRFGAPLLPELQKHQGLCDSLKLKAAQGGQLHVEHPMAVRKGIGVQAYSAVDYHAADRWCRMKLDAVLVSGTNALIIDWKTGSKRHDSLQLKLYAGAVALAFPGIQKITSMYVWLKESTVSQDEMTFVDAILGLDAFVPHCHDMTLSRMYNNWPAKQGPLCGWCDATKAHCIYAVDR